VPASPKASASPGGRFFTAKESTPEGAALLGEALELALNTDGLLMSPALWCGELNASQYFLRVADQRRAAAVVLEVLGRHHLEAYAVLAAHDVREDIFRAVHPHAGLEVKMETLAAHAVAERAELEGRRAALNPVSKS
jgi:hypothetical protein